MDAFIGIGGQSFVDGLLRILGPALEPLRAPLPIALPGITNGLLSIRSIRPVLPSAQGGTIQLDLELEFAGDLLLVASVANGVLNLGVANGTVTLPPSTGSINEPARNAALSTNPGAGSITGGAVPLGLSLNALTGTVALPTVTSALSLNQIVGTIQLPATGNLGLPLPAVVPVPLDLAQGTPIRVSVLLSPIVNGLSLTGQAAPIDATSGFGIEFSFAQPTVQVPALTPATITGLQTALTNAFQALTTQLLQGLPPIVQPAANLNAAVTGIAGAIPAVIQSTLAEAFGALRARTGRLIFPTPAPGSSCDVRALPVDARVRINIAADGSPFLQIGFKRSTIQPNEPFAFFSPSGPIEVGVSITNVFLIRLLACLVERLPNLSITAAPTFGGTATNPTATWTGVTLTVGPLALSGTMTLVIAGAAAGQGMPPSPKTITLTFALSGSIGAPLVIGPALNISLGLTLPLVFDLNNLASLTALRLMGPATITTFSISLGLGVTIPLIALGVAILGPIVAGLLPIIWPGFAAIASLIVLGPHILIGIVSGVIRNSLNQVLGGLERLVNSPAALPPGIFEAFGQLVPTTLVVDDLDAAGVLQTPTSPWAVLPLIASGRKRPPIGGTHELPGSSDTPTLPGGTPPQTPGTVHPPHATTGA